MILNDELTAIKNGAQGETMRKILKTLINFGEAFGAERMVPITSEYGHSVIGAASFSWSPVFDIIDEMIESGALAKQKFSADPVSYDPKVPASLLQKLAFKIIFSAQNRLENQYKKFGIMDEKAYSCTCYMPELGNIPKKGDILGWAESSAVSYANSVLGARCNRNSGVLELMSFALGYVPEFGLLLDEGRRADWIIEVRCEKKPEAQILGSAIGMKVIEDVPYIKGLNNWLGTELTQDTCDYLKDMGAAAASNGSVGLYHVENLTPEAAELGESLINEGAQIYVIDDAELEKVRNSYPCLWEDKNAEPELCFMGCPHFSKQQLIDWCDRLSEALQKNGQTELQVPTVFTAAPDVIEAFISEQPERYKKYKDMGLVLSPICALTYTSNPLIGKVKIITGSNKLRYYSHARFHSEAELLEILTGGAK